MITQHLRLVAIFFFALQIQLFAQTAPAETRDEAKVTVVKHGWSAKGALVLAVEIKAGAKSLALGSVGLGGSSEVGEPIPFSMAGSILTDAYSGQTFPAFNALPRRPFYGTMEAIIQLRSDSAMTFGVAFPHPPDPPYDKNGNPQDYKFILKLPDREPIEFSLPFTPKTNG